MYIYICIYCMCVCINNDRSMLWPTKNSDLTNHGQSNNVTLHFPAAFLANPDGCSPLWEMFQENPIFCCKKKPKDLASTLNFSLSKQNQSVVESCLLVELWWFSILRWFKNHTAHFGIMNGNHDPRNRCAGKASIYSVNSVLSFRCFFQHEL